MPLPVRGDKLSWRVTQGCRICGSQLEMRRTQQRDELVIAVWKWGQPEKWDNQAPSEEFLLHMYIGAAVPEYIYIYIATMCLLNSACQQEVCFLDQRRYLIRNYVSDINICHYLSTQPHWPTGSVIEWMKSRARYIYIPVDVVFKYIYILHIFVYSTPLALGVYLCGRSRASMYIYIRGYCRYCIYILYGRSHVLDIYILPLIIYSTPLADRECACVDKVAIWYVYLCLICVYLLSTYFH